MEDEDLVEHAALAGAKFVKALRALAVDEPILGAVRGRGLMLAFDLPDRETRERFYHGLYEIGLLAIRCGERSIRFRPALDLPLDAVDTAMDMLREQCRRLRSTTVAGAAV
jgi:L-lysine 6-transaminase